MKNLGAYFLEYQAAWLRDKSPIKIWEKSRRIGASYVQAYEDVYDIALGRVPKVYYSSADEEAGKEYIDYCAYWARAFNIAAQHLGEDFLDEQKDVTAHTILVRGKPIHALSSNPRRFRSKGGKIILDEFAHHDDQAALYKAAYPAVTWGFPLRIFSSHNGEDSFFNGLIKKVNKGELKWSHHFTDILMAVEQGLLDKIRGRKTTKAERQEWLDELRANCVSEIVWQEEYLCQPVAENKALLPYELIGTCELDNVLCDLNNCTGDLYVGMDVGRRRDLRVIWVLELLGVVKYTRQIIRLEKTPFKKQRQELYHVLQHPRFRRACMDETGIGIQLAEEAQDQFGKYRVEPVTMTGPAKEEIGFQLLRAFEDRNILVPSEPVIRKDLHSIRRITTAAGNIRLDTAAGSGKGKGKNDEDPASHADYFWAAALANHACSQYKGPVTVRSRRRRESSTILRGYDS